VIRPTHAELLHKITALKQEIADCKRAERQQVDTELREQQARYKGLFQDAVMGILLLDTQFQIMDANRKALQVLGYTYEEITQMRAHDLVHPDDLNAQPLIGPKDIADPNREITLERHYRCKGGSYLPVAVYLRVFPSDTLMATFQDISQSKAAEKALRAANEALEVVYRCSNAAIVSLDRNACVSFWNPAAESMFGWTQAEVIGKPYPAVPEEKQNDYHALFKNKLDGKASTDMELLRQKKDGSRFFVSSTAGPLRDETGDVIGLISVMIDITKRKKAEEALLQSEERYRSLVENTQDGYFICDAQTCGFRFINQRMCDLLGYTKEEASGLTLWDVVAIEDHPAMEALIAVQKKGTQTHLAPQVYRAVRKHGAEFRAEVSTSLVTFEERPALQGLLRDITEKERLHAKLQQAQRLESVGTLAGGVAHDFNNLLMAIQGNTSLALTKISPSHPAHEKLKNITTYVQDAASLTKQLLGFARGGKYEVKATDLNKLIDKTTHMFGRTKKEITIRIHPQDAIWMVSIDRGQLEQVLLNLLVNAWQAMPKGGQIYIQTANVVLDTTYAKAYNVKPGSYVKTSVTDTGIGMDKAVQAKIFEPFFTTKDRSRGTGLGLASAYGIVKNHDGIINVYSEKNKGTTFTIYLPTSEKPLDNRTPAHQPPLAGNETVLLVDDEEMILSVGKEMLEVLGYHALVARSGQETLEIYLQEQEKIDLIILDMIMPEMSGGETYEQLKKINPNIKVLLASGYSLNGRASYILHCGCNGFIQKPFNIEELSHKMRDVLDNK
jgi:two-component system, cell cycle sensor histidine kinase and response regulator CckA